MFRCKKIHQALKESVLNNMRLSIVSDPVKRPDIIYPHRAVDVIHGRVEDLVSKKAEGKKKF